MAPTIFALTAFLTSVIAGFMIFYCILVGRYFNFIVKSGYHSGLSDRYAEFRAQSGVVRCHGALVGLQAIVAVVSAFLNWGNYPHWINLAPIAPLPLLFVTHIVTGFRKAEGRVNGGRDLSSQNKTIYLRYNIPLHLFHSMTYSTAALVLILSL